MTTCTLCDLPAEDGITASDVDGEFCCRGCLEVYRRLGDVDVSEEEVLTQETDRTEQSHPDTAETAYLAVDGMHCSTCEVFLESEACRRDGIYDAEASYAAETIKLVYDPEERAEGDLLDVVSGMGYHARKRDDQPYQDAGAVSRLLVGGIFGMMVMTWYALFLYPTYFGYDPVVEFGQFDGLYLYSQFAIMTGIIIFYTGRPMLRGAYVSLRAGRPNVDLLVTIAALAAFTYSTARLLVGGTDFYYDVSIVVVLAVTVGNFYEERIKRRTAGLLADLTELQVEEATLEDGETIPVEEISSGDRLRVAPGERVPVDGTVEEGTAAVDESLVTGESIPETKRPGDEVRGGTVVTDAPLVVTAGPEGESTLDRVVELLWDIQATRPGAQRVADRLATVFVPLVLVLGAGIAAWLLLTGSSPRAAVLTGLTVLIVSCPCALGLATPLAVASGLQSAASNGIVVATPELFEHAGEVDTLVLDKTGTITDGEMAVTTATSIDGDETDLLARAGAVEQYAEHPIAEAIAETADDTRPSVDLDTFESETRGVSAVVDGERVLVGHPTLFRDRDWTVPVSLEEPLSAVRERGNVPVVVGWDERARGVVGVGDTPREDWEVVAESFEDCDVVVLTGDDGAGVERFRDHEGVDDVFAGVPPDGKAETVRRLAATETVAMVGDGSNDAPALAAADVGIALESGTQLATDAADAVVLEGDLHRVPAVFDIASGTKRRIRENLAWAFLYNAIAIPLALAQVINPLFAALAMATSSLLVVVNSARTPTDATDTRSAAEAPTEETAPASGQTTGVGDAQGV
ncbi:Cu2+-exporting ATPase [Halovenus aranensis]|uniref:Cu2+-exporting ATPase n=1 Tax=Halovenus aranensis TaxID=890420 RepID=A0A1G8TTY9_9EURY|nr:cation-translocating P-type ATPase [Halovenus aranensis]SDJ44972.1 Cu2+-exporting ATPase [Halovenus aranensis]